MRQIFRKTARSSTNVPRWDTWIPVCASILSPRKANIERGELISDLSAINRVVNQYITYTPDADGTDHWASIQETLNSRKGDCEDFATVKMATAKDMGYDLHQFSIVIVQNTYNSIYHAVCAYDLGLSCVILDNQGEIFPDIGTDKYEPLYAYGVYEGWIFE